MDKMLEIVGEKIGKLKIDNYAKEKDKNGKNVHFYYCSCDCGNKAKVRRGDLTRKDKRRVSSCGCLQKELLSQRVKKHGLRNSKFYRVWSNIKTRTLNPKSENYKFYGGRGIKISNDWLQFENFRDDMYKTYLEHIEKYGEKDTTIERKDPDKDYNKNNCVWATIKEQSLNQRRHKRKFKATNLKTGEEFIGASRSEFAREHNISSKHIGSVLNGNRKSSNGFTFEYID